MATKVLKGTFCISTVEKEEGLIMSEIFRCFLVVHARLQAKTVSFASSKCYSV